MRSTVALSVLALASASAATQHGPKRVTRTTTPSNTTVSVSLPLTAPSSAQTLSRSLVSFSIEGDRWAEWAGIDAPNTFFLNCLSNLHALTGQWPGVRVGANSEDKTTLIETVNVVNNTFPAITTTTPYPEAAIVQVSSEYYALSKRMPAGTHMIWGVNFGANNLTNAVNMAKAIAKQFAPGGAAHAAGVSLDMIEIGNEADLYGNNGLRNKTWTITDYISQWSTFAQAIVDAVGMKPNSSPSLLLASFGFTTTYAAPEFSWPTFTPQTLFSSGLVSGPLGKYVNTISQHHYSGSFCTGSGGLLSDLMAKDGIRGNVSAFDPDIAASQAQGLTYIFGETNSYSCHGAPGVSNSAGAAIWALDYVLQAATRGIRTVHFHDGVGFKYDLIQPVTLTRSTIDGTPLGTPLAPHVQPQYYAGIVAATFIGSFPGSLKIAELSVPNENIGGYAAYENGVLVRAVFINNNAYFADSTGPRPYQTISLSCLGNGLLPTVVQVRRLTIAHADDTSGVTFAGRSYETASGLPSGSDKFELVHGASGIKISDTEAVLLTFL